MIDRFRRIALRLQILRLPAIVIGLACAIWMIVVVFTSESRDDNLVLLPGFVGMLWAISLYSFIESFSSVPVKLTEKQGFIGGFKHRIRRGWYWFKGLVFLLATAVALLVTSRMISIWLAEYAV